MLVKKAPSLFTICAKGTSRLVWDQAKEASRDAWNRVESAARGFANPAAK